ncbi:hypothetical protein BD626DRAFT_565310 [Schizophyllum amplum]|uniref:F-box domain-containing protein n=1 Tax=Schizophyllum amplum TaxID=97359 RepID=A0A550CUL0_9AGAR|nr:hypothetical protein BD626DRAFT_565310 [Auriculariopsis ampla]
MAPLITGDLSNVDISMDVDSPSTTSSSVAAMWHTLVFPRVEESDIALAPPCHIDNLPHELLDMVITFAVEPELTWPVNFYEYNTNTLRAIKDVCHTWRAISLRHPPSVYQHIAVGTPRPKKGQEQPVVLEHRKDWLAEHIQRSAGKPLHVIIQTLSTRIPDSMAPLFAISDRWESAAINCDIHICVDDLDTLKGRLQQLQQLTLCYTSASDTDTFDCAGELDSPLDFRVFQDAPLLTSLELRGPFGPHIITPFFPKNQLKYLSCADTDAFDLFLVLLDQTESLCQLRWTGSWSAVAPNDGDMCESITLPRLTKLALGRVHDAYRSGALAKLHLPALQELDLHEAYNDKESIHSAAKTVELLKSRATVPDALVVRHTPLEYEDGETEEDLPAPPPMPLQYISTTRM